MEEMLGFVSDQIVGVIVDVVVLVGLMVLLRCSRSGVRECQPKGRKCAEGVVGRTLRVAAR